MQTSRRSLETLKGMEHLSRTARKQMECVWEERHDIDNLVKNRERPRRRGWTRRANTTSNNSACTRTRLDVDSDTDMDMDGTDSVNQDGGRRRVGHKEPSIGATRFELQRSHGDDRPSQCRFMIGQKESFLLHDTTPHSRPCISRGALDKLKHEGPSLPRTDEG